PHRGVALGDQGHALDGVDQAGGRDHGGDRGGVREQAPHRRVLAVDEGRGGASAAGLEPDQGRGLVLGQGDLDAAAGGQGAGDLVEGAAAHQGGELGAGGGGVPGQLAQRQAVPVGGHQRHGLAADLDLHAGQQRERVVLGGGDGDLR